MSAKLLLKIKADSIKPKEMMQPDSDEETVLDMTIAEKTQMMEEDLGNRTSGLPDSDMYVLQDEVLPKRLVPEKVARDQETPPPQSQSPCLRTHEVDETMSWADVRHMAKKLDLVLNKLSSISENLETITKIMTNAFPLQPPKDKLSPRQTTNIVGKRELEVGSSSPTSVYQSQALTRGITAQSLSMAVPKCSTIRRQNISGSLQLQPPTYEQSNGQTTNISGAGRSQVDSRMQTLVHQSQAYKSGMIAQAPTMTVPGCFTRRPVVVAGQKRRITSLQLQHPTYVQSNGQTTNISGAGRLQVDSSVPDSAYQFQTLTPSIIAEPSSGIVVLQGSTVSPTARQQRPDSLPLQEPFLFDQFSPSAMLLPLPNFVVSSDQTTAGTQT